jgi:hypothetical protein
VRRKRTTRPSAPLDRWKTLNAFVDNQLSQLNTTTAVVWFALFRKANGQTGLARVTVSCLARLTNLSRTTVYAALKELVRAELLSVDSRERPPEYRLFHEAREVDKG